MLSRDDLHRAFDRHVGDAVGFAHPAVAVEELDLVGVFTGWNVYDDFEAEYAFRLFYDRVVMTASADR